MSEHPTDRDAVPRSAVEWSRSPATAWVLLAIALPLGGWLAWEVERTIGLSEPHFWNLLRNDRLFGLAMLDFFLTAGWAALVLVERARVRDWRLWVSLIVFCVAPSVGIAIFILLDRARPRVAADGGTGGTNGT